MSDPDDKATPGDGVVDTDEVYPETSTTLAHLTVSFASTEVNVDEQYCVIDTQAGGLTTVRFYEETITHVAEQHAATFPAQFPVDLPSILHAVGDAVRSPTLTKDSYNNSVRFIGSTVNSRNHPLNVLVQKLDKTTSGFITTYFFTGIVEDVDDD